MSSLLVPVTVIEKILPHSNADSLEIAHVLGWQLVVRKGQFQVGEKLVYFPIDTVLPVELSDRLQVTNYLSKQRIRCARLRGEPSFGLAIKPDLDWEVGENVADYYKVEKYSPPIRVGVSDAEVDHPLFVKYTEIENMRNFPHVFVDGEEVIITEKIHGTSSRIGSIEGEWMAGSHAVRRKQPENVATNLYWYPFSSQFVNKMIEALEVDYRQIIVYGEIYGSKIQSLNYGQKNNNLGYRVFDILLDGRYLDWDDMKSICATHHVETVPELARIPYSIDAVKAYSDGPTTLLEENAHMREGVVVKPVRERRDYKIGRCILKYVGDEYLFGKKTDYTDQ